MDMQRGQRKGARTGTGELLDVVEGQLPVGAPTGWLTYNKIIKMALLCRRHIRDGDRRTDWLPWAPGCMVGLANGATPSAQLARQISPAGAALWEGMRSERGNWGWRSAQRLPGAAARSALIAGTRVHGLSLHTLQWLDMSSHQLLTSAARAFPSFVGYGCLLSCACACLCLAKKSVLVPSARGPWGPNWG